MDFVVINPSAIKYIRIKESSKRKLICWIPFFTLNFCSFCKTFCIDCLFSAIAIRKPIFFTYKAKYAWKLMHVAVSPKKNLLNVHFISYAISISVQYLLNINWNFRNLFSNYETLQNFPKFTLKLRNCIRIFIKFISKL